VAWSPANADIGVGIGDDDADEEETTAGDDPRAAVEALPA